MKTSETVNDKGSIKLEKINAFMYLIICHLEIVKITNSFGDICKKPKFENFVFIYKGNVKQIALYHGHKTT